MEGAGWSPEGSQARDGVLVLVETGPVCLDDRRRDVKTAGSGTDRSVLTGEGREEGIGAEEGDRGVGTCAMCVWSRNRVSVCFPLRAEGYRHRSWKYGPELGVLGVI